MDGRSLHYFSTDPEFSTLSISLVEEKEKEAAPSANKPKEVIGKNKDSSLNRKYFIKTGATPGNTLAELASYLRLLKVREIDHEEAKGDEEKKGEEKKGEEQKRHAPHSIENPRYAKTFLVTERKDRAQRYTTADEFIDHLAVASLVQPVAYSISACQIFGYKKRPKPAAASFHPELFEYIRRLNAECDLGLDSVFFATELILDLDFHTDNYRLNFDISMLDEEEKKEAEERIQIFKNLFEAKTYKPKNDDQEVHFSTMAGFIKGIKEIKNPKTGQSPRIYFHKIDHDSGLYRLGDSGREYALRDHGSSMFGNGRTQPTNHLSELAVGDSHHFILSEKSQEIIQANPIAEQVTDARNATEEFFKAITEQCEANIASDQEQLRAELILLKHFEEHITSGRKESFTIQTDDKIKKQIENTKAKILKEITAATIDRGIALHNEYLDFIKELNVKNMEKFKNFLEEDRNEGVILKVVMNKEKINYLSLGKNINAEEEAILGLINRKKVLVFKKNNELVNKLALGEKNEIIQYLSSKRNQNRPLYKIISTCIGEESMPLYSKSMFKRFREGLAGIRKIGFYLGGFLFLGAMTLAAITGIVMAVANPVIPMLLLPIAFFTGATGFGMSAAAGLTSSPVRRWHERYFPNNTTVANIRKKVFALGVLLAVAFIISLLITASIVTAGAALPLALPAAISLIGGTSLGATTIAGVTNPHAKSWFSRQSLFTKSLIGVGIVAAFAAATVLTGGAVLALAASVSLVIALAAALGIKAAAGVAATTVLATKGALIGSSVAGGVGLAYNASSTAAIAKGLKAEPDTFGAVIQFRPSISHESPSASPLSEENQHQESISELRFNAAPKKHYARPGLDS